MFGHSLTLVFLVATSLSLIVTVFFLSLIARHVYRARPNQKRKMFLLGDAPRILLAHEQLFPHNEAMLGFWLSLIFLLICLSGMTYSLLVHP